MSLLASRAKASGLTKQELAVFARLAEPRALQDFLDHIPMNHEKRGPTNMSPRRVLREQKAHCMEGALLAALALWLHGGKPLLLDLTSVPSDDDHVVALYSVHGLWGAISKTNHASLRFRDPIYTSMRELALSYFHEWFENTRGRKTLRAYSLPFSLATYDPEWITSEEELWWLAEAIDARRHYALFPKRQERYLRPADSMELKAGRLIEWSPNDPRT